MTDIETNPLASDSLSQNTDSGLTGIGLSEEAGTTGDTKEFISSDSLSNTPASTNDLSTGIMSSISKVQTTGILDSGEQDGAFTGLHQLISLPSPGSDFSASKIEQDQN